MRQFRKPKKFPGDVARFFHPEKSGTNAIYDSKTGALIAMGTHQAQKAAERSYIVVNKVS